MNEKLSSSLTFFHKVFLPALWVVGFGLGTLRVLLGQFNPPSHTPAEIRGIFLLAWIIGSAFMLRDTIRLKTVGVDKRNLVIKNFVGMIRVPFEDIKYISEYTLGRPKTITIAIYPPCKFGEEIVFIPKVKFQMTLNPFREHPIVERLRQLSGVKE